MVQLALRWENFQFQIIFPWVTRNLDCFSMETFDSTLSLLVALKEFVNPKIFTESVVTVVDSRKDIEQIFFSQFLELWFWGRGCSTTISPANYQPKHRILRMEIKTLLIKVLTLFSMLSTDCTEFNGSGTPSPLIIFFINLLD